MAWPEEPEGGWFVGQSRKDHSKEPWLLAGAVLVSPPGHQTEMTLTSNPKLLSKCCYMDAVFSHLCVRLYFLSLKPWIFFFFLQNNFTLKAHFNLTTEEIHRGYWAELFAAFYKSHHKTSRLPRLRTTSPERKTAEVRTSSLHCEINVGTEWPPRRGTEWSASPTNRSDCQHSDLMHK